MKPDRIRRHTNSHAEHETQSSGRGSHGRGRPSRGSRSGRPRRSRRTRYTGPRPPPAVPQVASRFGPLVGQVDHRSRAAPAARTVRVADHAADRRGHQPADHVFEYRLSSAAGTARTAPRSSSAAVHAARSASANFTSADRDDRHVRGEPVNVRDQFQAARVCPPPVRTARAAPSAAARASDSAVSTDRAACTSQRLSPASSRSCFASQPSDSRIDDLRERIRVTLLLSFFRGFGGCGGTGMPRPPAAATAGAEDAEQFGRVGLVVVRAPQRQLDQPLLDRFQDRVERERLRRPARAVRSRPARAARAAGGRVSPPRRSRPSRPRKRIGQFAQVPRPRLHAQHVERRGVDRDTGKEVRRQAAAGRPAGRAAAARGVPAPTAPCGTRARACRRHFFRRGPRRTRRRAAGRSAPSANRSASCCCRSRGSAAGSFR